MDADARPGLHSRRYTRNQFRRGTRFEGLQCVCAEGAHEFAAAASLAIRILFLMDLRAQDRNAGRDFCIAQVLLFNRIRRKRTLSEAQDPIDLFLRIRRLLKLPTTVDNVVAHQIRDVQVFRRAGLAEQIAL